MFHRFLNTVRSILLGVLAIAAWQPAAAEVFVYEATIISCAANCDPFAAVSVGSSVIGFLDIDVEPNGSFTETDIVNFGFEIFDSGAVNGLEPAVFDGATFVNPTESNPLPLDSRVVTFGEPAGYPFTGAIFGGSGTTGPNNELTGGQLVATFAVPPFNTFGAQIFFALGGGNTEGCLFGGMPGTCVALTTLEGGFSQLPGEIGVADNPTEFPDTAINDDAEATITVTNVAPMPGVDPCSLLAHDPATPPPPPFTCPGESGPLTIVSVATVDPLADPFSITDNGCGVLAPLGTCDITAVFSPLTAPVDPFEDSFDIVSNDPNTPSTTVDLIGTGLEPDIRVTPETLVFVATDINGDPSQAVATVENTGPAPLIIGMIDFSMLTGTPFSLVLDNCSLASLATDEECTVTLAFDPDVEDSFESGIIIPSNDPDESPLAYTIQGAGVVGMISDIGFVPTTLTFEQILVGEMSVLPVMVNSTGNGPLDITSITITGDDAIDFDADSAGCPASLDSGSNCTVNVTYEPLSGGEKVAALTVVSNAASGDTQDVPISASAFEGRRIGVDPLELELGSPGAPVDIGGSVTAEVTVTSTGTAPLSVGGVSICGPGCLARGGVGSSEFTVEDNGCTMPLEPPLGTCIITVGFSPLTAADQMDLLLISSDDEAGNLVVAVDLTGYVFQGPRVDVPDTVIDVDGGTSVETGQSIDFDLEITNSGTEDLEISGFELGGDDADDFSFTDTCVDPSTLLPVPVPPQETCVVTITFAPELPGEKSAELSIFSNDVTLVRAMTIVVQLSATANAPPAGPAPAAPGSQTRPPPSFALADPGGGTVGLGLLGLGLALLLARRRRYH